MSERESRQDGPRRDRQSSSQQQSGDQQSRGQQSGGQESRETQREQGQSHPLRGDRGDTSIQETVVSQVSGLAAQEIEGIRMGGGGSQRASGIFGSVTGGSGGTRTQGVSVEVGKEEAAIDLTLTVEYGRSAPEIADKVRSNVISRIESLTGLRVTEVNVSVTSLHFPEEEESQQQDGEQEGGQGLRSSSRVS